MTTEYPSCEERVFRTVLPNGLRVIVDTKPGFQKKRAYFSVDFGSVHRFFSVDGEVFEAPAGVAHFLEHKIFDMPGRDISAEFAALGASPNAFTSYDMTAYYFSCTDNFPRALRLLLEFVSTPYFTPESVAKEQGIIGQEIAMNEDNPDVQSFEKLMQCQYEKHLIREPILGTRETIAQITPEVLSRCHRAFYRPDNMILCVVGDVDPEEIVAIAGEMLPEKPAETVKKRGFNEPPLPMKQTAECTMEVAMTGLQMAFKCPDPGADAPRWTFVGELATDLLLGEASPLYRELYEEGLIDSSFCGGVETVDGAAVITCGGDTESPMAVRERILTRAKEIAGNGVPEEDFLRYKRSAAGRALQQLDSFDSLCFHLTAYDFLGTDYLTFPEIYNSVTKEDVARFLAEYFTPALCSTLIIHPIKE